MFKSAVREIKGSLGRYLAIFAIVIIGVGFFSGLSICKEAMLETADVFAKEVNLYDYRILSTLGFTNEDVESFSDSSNVKSAAGAYLTDAIVLAENNVERVFRVHSIMDDINEIDLLYGRMPTSGNECIADSQYYGERGIGRTITVSAGNSDGVLDTLAYDEYTIVGVGNSPYYMNIDRGTSDIGSGRISAYMCVPTEGFLSDYYQEIYITVYSDERAYSEEYIAEIDDVKGEITSITEERTDIRYDGILAAAEAAMAMFTDTQTAGEHIKIPPPPSVFILTREANVSYVSYENDSGIVGGIAKVFPVFFFLVAALVCITTMSRMVEEQRTQIGILKSLGYGNSSIISKYFIYSGSAGILGCLIGYFGGTFLFPAVIWKAFNMLYPFTESMVYVCDVKLLTAALCVTCLCTIGVTLLCCVATLCSTAANLIRPKSPKSGKRTVLERIVPLWNRLSFLQKVSLRNLFRYRQRFFMMIIGIGGCTALLVGGFGIRDSINNVVADQYERIVQYDAEVSFSSRSDTMAGFAESHSDFVSDFLYITTASVDISIGERSKNVSVTAPGAGTVAGYMELRSEEKEMDFPGEGEVIINTGLAKDMDIEVGDKVTFTSKGLKVAEVTVSGIFENYIGNFAYVSKETADTFFDSVAINGAYIIFQENTDNREAVTALLADEKVSSVSVIEYIKNSISDTMKSLNYIVLVVIICAGALAFVVLYNLANINITERIREIASIKVLGFYDNETSRYVFSENNILTVFGAGIGLVLGKFLHAYVMLQVNIEFIKFTAFIDWRSYVYSALLTIAFSLLMQVIMNRKLKRINMAESLKTVE